MYTTQKSKFLNLLLTLFLTAITSFAFAQATASQSASESESQLLGILRSDAPAADKAIACKRLAIVGTSNAVPELAKLLPDAELCSWVRIALEAIPGEESDEALRSAAKSLSGRQLIGVLNSIGVRHDAHAVEVLTLRLKDSDSEVASAAAIALGKIGNEAATNSLRPELTNSSEELRSAVAEGCVRCAEQLLATHNLDAAAKLYDEVRGADVPKQRKIEATRGAILARGQNGLPLLLETLRSTDKKMFQLGLQTAREFPAGDLDQALAAELDQTTPQRAALLIQAMADRPRSVVLVSVLKAAGQGDPAVRLTAIDAISRIGDDSCLLDLFAISEESDETLSEAAQATLANLPGEKVDSRIVAMLADARGKRLALLLKLIGQRRIEAVAGVTQWVDNSDPEVRHAALLALGETVSLDRLPLLISQAVQPRHAMDQVVAAQALKAASIRMPDRAACATELTNAVPTAPPESRVLLLEILGEVGGPTALQTLAIAASSDDPQFQDIASRLLGKWNDVEAAPVLLDLAKSSPAEKYRVRAIRGYIGLIRKFDMPEQERVQMCRTAMETATRPADQQLVLDVMQLYPSREMLKLAVEANQNPALEAEAAETVLAIQKKLDGNRPRR